MTSGGLTGFRQHLGKHRNDVPQFVGRRLRFIIRRHLAKVQLIKNFLKQFAVGRFGEIEGQLIKTSITILFRITMALVAVIFQKSLNGIVCLVGIQYGRSGKRKRQAKQ